MPAGDQTAESFASVYLGRGKSVAGRAPRQQDLFEAVAPVPVARPSTGGLPTAGEVAAVAPAPRLWTVRELVGQIRLDVERTHVSVWVEGEVSNCRPAPSGHLYFTLKDGEAQLPVVLFRRQAQLLAAKPKDGDAVEVRGRISIYESRGQLQLIAETLELRGAGALELAFKRLKARLLAEGLFEEGRKRALPAFPHCIGVVTSLQGAVIRDIVHVVRRRHARLNLLVYPATMQGAGCCGSVAAGIRWFNRHAERVDLIILARGGGSIEDLAGFNEEALARAIAGSALPVVSAIGHETDFTIADFVADLRAATPSAAAEMVTAAQHRIEERVGELAQRVHRAGRYQMMCARQRYARLSAEAVLQRLRDAVSRRDQRMDELRLRLEGSVQRRQRLAGQRLALLAERLRRQDPTERLGRARHRLARADEAMGRMRASLLHRRYSRFSRAEARLLALSPLAVLHRGYALVYLENGALLRSAQDTTPGQMIRARLASGSLTATVKDIDL